MWPSCLSLNKCLLSETISRCRQSQPTLAGFGEAITLAESIDQLIAAKRAANLRPVYLKSLRYYLNRFAHGREQSALESLTTADVETFLRKFSSANTRATWQNRINTLFAFAVRRDFITRSPCDKLERIKVSPCRSKPATGGHFKTGQSEAGDS